VPFLPARQVLRNKFFPCGPTEDVFPAPGPGEMGKNEAPMPDKDVGSTVQVMKIGCNFEVFVSTVDL
jgi:hypothetical protein